MSEAPRDTAPNAGAAADAFGGAVPVRLHPDAESASGRDADPSAAEAPAGASEQEADSANEPIELSPEWRADPENPDGPDVTAGSEATTEAEAETPPAPSSPWPPVGSGTDASAESPVRPDSSDSSAGTDSSEPPAASPADAADHADALPRLHGQTLPDPDGSADRSDDPDNPDDKDSSDKADTPEQPMTLMDHLGELRTRLVRCLIGATIGFFLCYGIAEQLFYWLAMPLAAVMPQDTRLIYTSVPEGFFVYLKVAFVAGVFVSSPYIFYQVWAFVAPGLYKEERQQILPLSLFSALFFILGASFCYFAVFPYAFTFFMSYSTGMIVAMPSIDEYLGFSLKMLIAFGLIFEMPLFAFFLARMGIVTAAWMRKVRRYAILAVFVVAAILTPPDVFSQMLMAGPMLLLYEISIFVAAAVGRKEKPAAAAAETP